MPVLYNIRVSQMQIMSTVLSFLSFGRLFEQLTSTLNISNHILQAVFCSLAVCSLVALILKTIHFAYYKEISQNKITKVFGFFVFFYLKIWDYYSGVIYALSIFSFVMIALYVYDCCGNISQHLDSWRQQNRDLAVILSFVGMFSTTMYILWQIFKNKQVPLVYQYSGIYLLTLVLIVIGNFLRRRSIIYALMGVLVINYLIAARYLLHRITHSKSTQIQATKIPFETVVYFMMALDAQKKERVTMNSQSYTSLFQTCAAVAAYSILNDGQFPLQLFVGGLFILGLIINR